MEKDSYRQSGLSAGCSAIRSPSQSFQLLAENKESSPSEIARAIGESVQRVRAVLSALCLANEAGDAHLSLAFGAVKRACFTSFFG